MRKVSAVAVLLSGGLLPIADARADGTELETITVVAQRRVENIQGVPISMAAIGADALQRRGIGTVEGLNTLIPNAMVEHVGIFPNAAALSIRGVGYSGIESFTDPDVAVYIDGIYQPRNATALTSTLDVSEIEVLRGPQGTLYGRNAFAGVISVTTTRPVMDARTASAALTYGNDDRLDVDLIGNLPLVDGKAAFRVAARNHRLDGFYSNNGIVGPGGAVDPALVGNPIGAERNITIRPSLRFMPNDDWDISLLSEVYRDRSKPGPSQHLVLPGSALATAGFPGFNPYGDQKLGIAADGSDPYRIGYSLQNRPSNIDSHTVTADASYKSGIGTFRALLNVSHVDEEIWTDTDGENVNAFTSARWQTYSVVSGDFQYLGNLGPRLDLTTGVFFLHDHYQTTQLLFSNFAAPFPAVFAVPGSNPAYVNNDGKRSTWAAYGQAEYHLTDRLSAVAGGRYSWERKYGQRGLSATVAAAGLAGTTDFSAHSYGTNPALVFGPIAQSWHNFAPRLGVNYRVDADLLLYTFWQRAYKSGGFNANSADRTGFNTPYGQERVDSFEGGLKSEWFARRLRLNVNAFYSKFTGLQRSLVTPSPTAAAGVVTITTNAANLDSYGLELEATAKVDDHLVLFANVGWNKASYASYCAPLAGLQTTLAPAPGRAQCAAAITVTTGAGPRYLVPADYASLVPIRAPQWDVSVGFTQDFGLGRAGDLSFNGSVNYRSAAYVNLLNVPYSFRRGMAVVDAGLTWTPDGKRYGVTLWGRNLANRIDILNYLPVGAAFASGNPTPPRTYGVTVNIKL